MDEIINNVSSFWSYVLASDEKFSKKDARKLLLDYAKELEKFDNSIYLDIRVKISGIIFSILRTLEKSPDKNEDLKVTAIIILKREEEVFYIYDKTLLKSFAVSNPWFFGQFRKAEIIAENEFYMLIKDKNPSNLGYLAHIILDKKINVLHQRPNIGEWAISFLNSTKN